jgi:membrane protein DedA with SNARE-associated domain
MTADGAAKMRETPREGMEAIVDWVLGVAGTISYPGIFLLMLLESSFFPFPSEVVMIPAGFLAYQGEMNAYLALIAGTSGSLAGAAFNFYLAKRWGRPLLLKFGKYFFFGPETLNKIDHYFAVHGEISTFNGRLIPGVRQYISLPAGLARMHFGKFILFTGLGAGIWVTILTALGYFLGSREELLRENLHNIVLAALLFVVVSTAIYIMYRRRQAKLQSRPN